MYKGTLAMVGPWEALVTFQQMIVLADLEGVVDMTADAISRETTIPLKIIAKGIEALEQPDPESRTPDEDGRRIVLLSEGRTWGWRIVNYEHYRKLRSEEERREYHRNYWREKRSKSATKKNSTTTQQNSTDSTNAVSNKHKVKVLKNRATKRAPGDFVLTDDLTDFARLQGMTDEVVQDEFESFMDCEFKSPKTDWSATWRTWCRNFKKWNKDEKVRRNNTESFSDKLARNKQRAGL